jgi:hypothetical protein
MLRQLLLKVFPDGHRSADDLKVEGAWLRADHHVENQSAVVGGVHYDRVDPECPSRTAGLRLAVVDVVLLVESCFGGSLGQNHSRRAGRIEPLLESGDAVLRVQICYIGPGITDECPVLLIRFRKKRIAV